MISRARPLLGTIVSIRAHGEEPALRAAFAAIERVHALMSAHADESDVARINRQGHRHPVRVHPWTFQVLSCARSVSQASHGAFDVTLGREGATYEDIGLQPDCRVSLRRRARLDLGGIAKGFAVDRAVAALRRLGASSGSVNAGGDLRLFGGESQTVRVRLPGLPFLSAPLAVARDKAFATSAGYFTGELIDARTQRPLCADSSVTVSTASCMVADALTKAVAAVGPQPVMLRRFDAAAYLVDDKGGLYAARS
jgi:thiamine biosynthesis lipoprotein